MQFVQEHCSIAWFKLAELIARKEKERALGIHRLLVHAIADDAYSLQLKGDLLYALYDKERALDAFQASVTAYAKTNRFEQAAFLSEQVLWMMGELYQWRVSAIMYFAELKLMSRLTYHVNILVPLVVADGGSRQLLELVADAGLSEDARSLIREVIAEQMMRCSSRLSTESFTGTLVALLRAMAEGGEEKKLTELVHRCVDGEQARSELIRAWQSYEAPVLCE